MKFCSENRQQQDHLEDLDVDERILKWIVENWVVEYVWLHLTEDRDQ